MGSDHGASNMGAAVVVTHRHCHALVKHLCHTISWSDASVQDVDVGVVGRQIEKSEQSTPPASQAKAAHNHGALNTLFDDRPTPVVTCQHALSSCVLPHAHSTNIESLTVDADY